MTTANTVTNVTTNETQAVQSTTVTTPVKRGRGRPKGSKNKPKVTSGPLTKEAENG